ncbi:cation:proton antiporter [Candidatus Woesearchaeota archaeon]|nr:cation:proton antiporter [Candidatus Woesearchaeota archaeon]
MNTIVTLLLALAAMFFLSEILRIVKVPRVVSHIIAGMIFGIPFLKDVLFTQESAWLIGFLADIGAILLLFFVGIQIDLRQITKEIVPSWWISFFNTILPLSLGFVASRYVFGMEYGTSLIVGVCMSVSATAIALDLMEEFGKLRTRLGALIVSAGSFDDIVELFLITSVLTVLETSVMHTSIAQLASGVVLFAILVVAFRLWAIPFVLYLVEQQPERAQLFTAALIITLFMASLAEILGIGALIGALFSGVIWRQVLLKDKGHRPWEKAEITHSMHTLAFGFIVPFFFFHVGFQTNILAIWQNLTFGIVITLLSIAGTVVGSATGYVLSYHNWNEAWIAGWAMNAKGDTELVIAQFALTAGVISSQVFSSLIFMALISTLISPFMLRHLLKKK